MALLSDLTFFFLPLIFGLPNTDLTAVLIFTFKDLVLKTITKDWVN